MAIEVGVRLNILSAQHELNIQIGNNIGGSGEAPGPTGAAATPKPVVNIVDAMPDASEPSWSEAPESDPRPSSASSSLAGLRAPEPAPRLALLRQMAGLIRSEPSDEASPRGAGTAAAPAERARGTNALHVDARSPAAAETRGPATAETRARAPQDVSGDAEVSDEAGDARFDEAFATLMRRAPPAASSASAADVFLRTAEQAPSDGQPATASDGPLDASLPGAEAQAPAAAAGEASAPASAPRVLERGAPSGAAARADDGGADPAATGDEPAPGRLAAKASAASPAGPGEAAAIRTEKAPALDAPDVAKSAVAAPSADAVVHAGAEAETAALADTLFAAALPAETSAAQPERAGVIASFILNAAMIPGWPPPRPIEGPPLQVLVGLVSVSKDLSEADKELLLYLASMGFSRKHLNRLLRKLEVAKNKSKLLRGLAEMLTNIAAAAKGLADEVASLLEDAEEEQVAMARTASGRARIDLR